MDGPLPLQERPLSAGGENEQFDLFETFVFVLIDMISEIMAVCGSLQQHSGEESLRRGYLESQNQVHNYDDGYDDFEPRPNSKVIWSLITINFDNKQFDPTQGTH